MPLPGVLLSAALVALIVVPALVLQDAVHHWFLLPLTACGVLVGIDAVDWLRGRLDLIDPAGLLGLLGLHFFLLAPLLHVHWDRWMRWVEPPPDWRDWLGAMAMLNAVGLVCFRFARQLPARLFPPRRGGEWKLDAARFPLVLLAAMAVTLLLHLWVLQRFGGLSGYIRTYTDHQARSAAFSGLGMVLMISESFPVLMLFGFVVAAKRHRALRSWPALVAFLLLFLVVQLVFGGLRGSRSNTIWAILWAGGTIHLLVRPLTRSMAAAAALLLVAFMYVYGFYKSFGAEAVEALDGPEERAQMVERSGRGVETILLGDLARADVQAFILHRLNRPDVDYQPALGRTYAGALALFVPRRIWPDRPATKVKEGTEIQYGRGLAYFSDYQSSRVYGLAGEAMLNFGPLAVPPAFAVLGFLVFAIRRTLSRWRANGDSRMLLAPLLINLCFIMLASDLDNIVVFVMKNGFVPFLVVALSSRRMSVRPLSFPSPSPRRLSWN